MAFKDARLKNGYTQAQLANQLNIERSTIAKWETGISYPRAELLPKIAALFGCSIEQLLSSPDTP